MTVFLDSDAWWVSQPSDDPIDNDPWEPIQPNPLDPVDQPKEPLMSANAHDNPTQYQAREELLAAAAGFLASRCYMEVHVENPHADAEMELREESLDAAARAYVKALAPACRFCGQTGPDLDGPEGEPCHAACYAEAEAMFPAVQP